MNRILSRVSITLSDRAVLGYVRRSPGKQLFEINEATLQSHHSWATKAVLTRLEQQGRLFVQRQRHGKQIKPRYFALA